MDVTTKKVLINNLKSKEKNKQNKLNANFKNGKSFYDEIELDDGNRGRFIEKASFKNVNTETPILIISINKEFKSNTPYSQKIARDITEEN